MLDSSFPLELSTTSQLHPDHAQKAYCDLHRLGRWSFNAATAKEPVPLWNVTHHKCTSLLLTFSISAKLIAASSSSSFLVNLSGREKPSLRMLSLFFSLLFFQLVCDLALDSQRGMCCSCLEQFLKARHKEILKRSPGGKRHKSIRSLFLRAVF